MTMINVNYLVVLTLLICSSASSENGDGPLSGNSDGLTPGLTLPTYEDGCGIIGNLPIGAWPWIAVLGYGDSSGTRFHCGGTIITKRHVLTAAECVTHNLNLVRFGEYDLNNDTETMHVDINIRKAVRHSDFRRSGRNDIGIIYMEQDIPFTDLIKPVCLPIDDNKYIGYQPFTVGWRKESDQSSLLNRIQVEIYQNDICEDMYKMFGNIARSVNINEAFICAGDLKGDSGVCEADTGGPLVVAENVKGRQYQVFQIGIVSRLACGVPEILSLFTKTAYYLEWIKQKIAEPF